MGYLNKVMLIGRICQDPEKRTTQNGHSVVNVSLATTEYFKDKSGNKQEKTEFHKVQFWDNLANIVEQYTKKGSQIYAEGSLQTREWQDKEGNKRYTTEVVARSVQLLDPRQQNQQSDPYSAPPQNHSGNQQKQDDWIEDDIPF